MARLLDFMSYSEYLASPRWKEVRTEALARAGGRCVLCNSSMGLQGHHRDYSTLGTPEEIDEVTILCQECHKLFSERIPTVPADGVRIGALSEAEAAR